MADRSYLKPKTKAPLFLRAQNQQNGQFVNPPLYMNFGGFRNSQQLDRGKLGGNMQLERGGPSSRRGKPI